VVSRSDVGPAEREHWPAGDCWSLGRAGFAAASCAAAHRRGSPPPGPRPRNRSARGTRRNDRASWQARERPTATSARATTPSRGLSCEPFRAWHLRGSVRSALPEPPPEKSGCLPEPVKSALRRPFGIGYAAP
jgi:hypothetical protein